MGSGTKLRMCGIWEGAARRLRPQLPWGNNGCSFLACFSWFPLHPGSAFFLLHTSLETFHVVPPVAVAVLRIQKPHLRLVVISFPMVAVLTTLICTLSI